MILGIGSDLVDIKRLEKTIKRYGKRFVNRIFTIAERKQAEKRSNPVNTYAKRFAAKEACAKALGTGMNRGVKFRDFGVINSPSGQPVMKLTGKAREVLKAITPKGMKAVVHLSISDEMSFAHATVVIEAREE